jgi:hypothetical protein
LSTVTKRPVAHAITGTRHVEGDFELTVTGAEKTGAHTGAAGHNGRNSFVVAAAGNQGKS